MTWIGGSRGGKVSSGQNDLSSILKKTKEQYSTQNGICLTTVNVNGHFFSTFPHFSSIHCGLQSPISGKNWHRLTKSEYQQQLWNRLYWILFFLLWDKRDRNVFFSNKKEERGKNWNCETAAVSYRSSLPRNFWLGQIQQSSSLTATIGLTCELL